MAVLGIELREIEAQPTAVARRVTTLEAIGEAIQSGFAAVFGALEHAGVALAGEPFARYHSLEPERIEVEIGVAVGSPWTPQGEVEASELPGGPTLIAHYAGPFEGVSEAYDHIQTWCAARHREPDGPFWECYLTDPATEPDSAKWRTDVYCPLRV